MKPPILNLLSPTSDLHRISPHIISMISSRQVFESKEKYQLGDYQLIQFQILQFRIT